MVSSRGGLLNEMFVLPIWSILEKAFRVNTSGSSSEPQKKNEMLFVMASSGAHRSMADNRRSP